MPVTTSISMVHGDDVNPAFGSSNLPDLAALTFGGFAMVRDNGSTSILEIYNDSGLVGAAVTGLPGTNASVTQLDNGNLAIVYQDADSILFEVRDLFGNVVVASTDMGLPIVGSVANLNPTVVAVAGGFQIGYEVDFGTDTDTVLIFVSTAGVPGSPVGAARELSTLTGDDETDVASVVLTNGTVAYAWELTNLTTGNSRIWSQVQSADGTVAIADNILVDDTGSINRNPAIVAALANQPYSAAEARVRAARCTLAPAKDGFRLTATLDMPSAGGSEVVVIEPGASSVWASETTTRRQGGTLVAEADLVHSAGKPFALDRSDVRITVLGAKRAVDIRGCAAD